MVRINVRKTNKRRVTSTTSRLVDKLILKFHATGERCQLISMSEPVFNDETGEYELNIIIDVTSNLKGDDLYGFIANHFGDRVIVNPVNPTPFECHNIRGNWQLCYQGKPVAPEVRLNRVDCRMLCAALNAVLRGECPTSP